MKPKKKAKELVDRFRNVKRNDQRVFWYNIEGSKQCALICVEEALKVLNLMDGGFSFQKEIQYWQEVKQQLNSL